MTANLPARSGIFVPIRNTMKKRNRYDTDCSAFAVVMNRLVVELDFFKKRHVVFVYLLALPNQNAG